MDAHQLAHNGRDPKTGQPRAEILYNFGRADQLDLNALRREVKKDLNGWHLSRVVFVAGIV